MHEEGDKLFLHAAGMNVQNKKEKAGASRVGPLVLLGLAGSGCKPVWVRWPASLWAIGLSLRLMKWAYKEDWNWTQIGPKLGPIKD